MKDATVLHVNAESTWRGGENQVYLLAKGMSRHRSCAVACVPGSPLATRLTDAGVATHAIPGDRGWRALLALRRIIKQIRPLVLHAHTSRAHQLCLLAGWGTGLPVLVTRRVDFPLKRGPFASWKYRGGTTRFVAISHAIKDILLQGGVSPERVEVIPSGVDFSQLDSAAPFDPRQEFNLPSDALVVLNVAALTDHKDQATLLRAWEQIERSHPRAHLVIAGEGELRSQLTTQMSSLQLKRAYLVGHRGDVPGLMKRSTIFVMSSHLEGLCTSIMDAKRCGLPVVATRAGGIPEVVNDGRDGLLVAIRDPSALASAMGMYLSDESRRLHDAKLAMADSERFSAETMVQRYVAFYAAMTGLAGSRPDASSPPSPVDRRG